ncbi:MAG TPA: CAP domain-containing protein [Hyphomicrobium sp.]|nr:CAP domain-containing protein [Hyphomicrobium sp.]
MVASPRQPRHLQRARFIGRGALALSILMMPVASYGAETQPSGGDWSTQTIPAPVAAPAVAPPRPLTEFERQAAETIKITNDFRRRNGLPEFKEDAICSAAAFDHARDMAGRGYFDHYGRDGSSPTIRYRRRNTAGQRVIRITENIARGNGTTPESALRMWLNSSGHRKHLVGTEMNHIGVGVANGSCFFGPCTYFVQCFSRWP